LQLAMRKKIYTLFLLSVLAIQMLPIQQMGCLLFGNQFTEEIAHADIEKDCFKKVAFKSDYLYTPDFSLGAAFVEFNRQHPHLSIAIPANHTGDIHVPPPNC
jgi:hypothetical protein